MERLRRALPAVIGFVLFVAALEVLRTELRTVSWQTLVASVLATPRARLAAAALLTAINYAVLTGYDFLAFAYLGKRVAWKRVAVTSFIAYAVASNVGFALLSGASVRYRFYTRWGVAADELPRMVFSYVVTFWLGLLLLGGLSLTASALPESVGPVPPVVLRLAGVLLMSIGVGYIVAACLRVRPIRVGRLELPLPRPGVAVLQLTLSVVDWLIAGAVIYVLLPTDVPFLTFLGVFLSSQVLALVSHVPGGVGVFEGLMVVLLKPFVSSASLLPALLVYRVVYYLAPLALALLLLVADEVRQRRSDAARIGAAFGWLTEQLTPRVLAVFTFLAGVVLLVSGATPAAAERLRLLDRILPLGVIEASHFLGSIAGAGLLLLSQGLARRLDAAYFLTVTLIVVGISASLLKGADYEEAVILAAVWLVLWRARPAFERRAMLFDTRFSPGWIVAVASALGASVWLTFFAFKHVEYSHELWWQFELSGDASRAMRALVGAAIAVFVFAAARLVGHAPHEVAAPGDDDLDAAARVIESQLSTFPYLVYLRDKGLLFDEAKRSFIMYGVQGRSWIALGDPVGPVDGMGPLIRRFLERCDDFGGVPVFYEISRHHLHRYADVGLTFVKLGEDARVHLMAFSLEGGHAKKYRQVLHRLEKTGATFRIAAVGDVPALIPQLRAVSDDWLDRQSGGEKGFSLGFFAPDYLARFPIALVEHNGRVVAFANLWCGPQRVELSLDLMRFHHDAPTDVMEALMLHVMMWGKAEGYQWFSLGMAPLSGFEASPIAPLWNRLASFLYEHGEAVYNFQGLRAYKEKFNPVWEPRYLAYPGGLRLPRILADVSALVAGGYRHIFLK